MKSRTSAATPNSNRWTSPTSTCHCSEPEPALFEQPTEKERDMIKNLQVRNSTERAPMSIDCRPEVFETIRPATSAAVAMAEGK